MIEIEYYKTKTGNIPYEEFRKKMLLINEDIVLMANKLIIELQKDDESCIKRKILKPLDASKGLYELKRKGKGLRIGIYLAKIPGTKKYVVLHAFLKKTQKTPKRELNTMKERIKDYKERFEK